MSIDSKIALMTDNGQMIAKSLLRLQPENPCVGDIVVRETELGLHFNCSKAEEDVEFLHIWASADKACDQLMKTRFQDIAKKVVMSANDKQQIMFAMYRAN